MTTRTTNDGGQFEQKLERALGGLIALLEKEREALLAGDARKVAELSEEKAAVASAIPQPKDGESPVRRREIVMLAKRVGDLAASNHALIEQMYRHYNGMLELLMRLSGQAATYGPTGAMNEPQRLDVRSHRIIA